MSLVKRLWLEEGLYPTEDFEFGDEELFEGNYDFYELEIDPVVTGDDDGKFNFGNIDNLNPHATGNYDMNDESISEDYNFFDIDEDEPVIGEDDGKFNFTDNTEEDNEPEAEGDWDFNKSNPIEPAPEDEDYNFFDIDEDEPVIGEDDNKYNFGDLNPLDVVIPDYDFDINNTGDDDYLFNFGSTDSDDSDPVLSSGDYDLEEDPNTLRRTYDFYDLLEDDPISGEDDNKYNFGDLEEVESFNEYDWDMENDELPVDLDKDYNEDDDEDVFDLDFGEAEDDEEYTFDFTDVDEIELHHTQFDLEYDFGEEEKVGWIATKNFLIKAFKDSIEELTHSSKVRVLEDNDKQELSPYITFQYYYNERTNKSFIQFSLNTNNIVDYDKLKKLITWRIRNQFRLDTGIWGELINTSEKDIIPDNSYSVTPYTIGYWKSVDGKYEAIEDRTEVEMDLRDKQLPPTREANIWDLYQISESISRKYNLLKNLINITNKAAYIAEYQDIAKKYSDPKYKEVYKNKISELETKYNSTGYKNENIPEAVNEYMTWYKEYFNANIPDVNTYTRRCSLKAANI